MSVVWLVEDDADERFFIKKAMDSLDYDVTVVDFMDGQKVCDALADSKDYPDLILLDLKLPKRSGYEVLGCIHDITEVTIPVVICSGSKSVTDVEKAWAYGSKGYFSKPESPKGYREMVQTIFTYWLSPILLRKPRIYEDTDN